MRSVLIIEFGRNSLPILRLQRRQTETEERVTRGYDDSTTVVRHGTGAKGVLQQREDLRCAEVITDGRIKAIQQAVGKSVTGCGLTCLGEGLDRRQWPQRLDSGEQPPQRCLARGDRGLGVVELRPVVSAS